MARAERGMNGASGTFWDTGFPEKSSFVLHSLDAGHPNDSPFKMHLGESSFNMCEIVYT